MSIDVSEEHRLRLQVEKISSARNQRESRWQACWFLAKLVFHKLKMEAIRSSETSVDIQRTIRCYIPEDCSLSIHYFGKCSCSRGNLSRKSVTVQEHFKACKCKEAVKLFRVLLSRWFLCILFLGPWKWRRCSSETSIDIQRTTRRYIPEDSTLLIHRCENLKSYK
jgi:hypothetical protein